MTARISDSSWITQGSGLAELLHRTDEPTVAVAYALHCGVMVAQGRFGEAWHWLGRAERMLQPAAEPGIEVDRNTHADLNTVKTRMRHLCQKLGPHSRGDAVRRARAFGLLASSPRSV